MQHWLDEGDVNDDDNCYPGDVRHDEIGERKKEKGERLIKVRLKFEQNYDFISELR